MRRTHALILLGLLAACRTTPDVHPEPLPGAYGHYTRVGAEAYRRGDLTRAQSAYQLALNCATEVHAPLAEQDALTRLGLIEESLGKRTGAEEMYRRALSAGAGHAPDALLGATMLNIARLRLADGDLIGAAAQLEAAAAKISDSDEREILAALRRHEAMYALACNDPEAAARTAREAARLYEISATGPDAIAGEADARLLLGRALRRNNDRTGAMDQLRRARNLGASVLDLGIAAAAEEEMARALLELGHPADARIRLDAATGLREQLGQSAAVKTHLARLVALSRKIGRDDLVLEYQARLDADSNATPGPAE